MPLRIAFLSYCSPVHAYVIGAIAARQNVVAVFRPVADAAGAAGGRRRRRLRERLAQPIRKLARHMNRCWLMALHERRSQRIVASLIAHPVAVPEHVDIPECQLHDGTLAQRIADEGIDLLITAGAPIIPPSLFRAPAWGSINLHYGHSPEFRGEDCLFWAWRFGAIDKLCLTIHRIDRGIDTGRILARVWPRLSPLTTEADLWAESAKLVPDAIDQMLSSEEMWPLPAGAAVSERIESGIDCTRKSTVPQNVQDSTVLPGTTSRLFRYADRTIYSEAIALLHRPALPTREPRIEIVR